MPKASNVPSQKAGRACPCPDEGTPLVNTLDDDGSPGYVACCCHRVRNRVEGTWLALAVVMLSLGAKEWMNAALPLNLASMGATT